jgi:EmrB/QacA subfamily drug resistance transporter
MLPVLMAGSFLSFLDFFIVNIALPAMRADLDASPSELQLVVAGYGIGFSVFLITGGRLGDIFGRKRLFLCGLIGFTATSAACGLAPTASFLIVWRVLQAVTAAMLTPQVLAIIRVEFPPGERANAIGLYGTSMGIASIVAQLAGGTLVSLDLFGLSWRLIFIVNVPVGVVTAILATRLIRESKSDSSPTLDWGGMGLITLSLFLVIFPLIQGREAGWPAWSLVLLAASVPSFGLFAAYERAVARRGRTPLFAFHLLRIPAIAYGLALSILFFGGLMAFFVVLTLFFQSGMQWSPLAAGLLFLPFALGFTAASAVSGRVTARIGDRSLALGTLLMAAGLAGMIALAARPQVTDLRFLVPLFAVYGLGQGLAQPGLINTVLGSARLAPADAGAASGLFLTVAQSALALGVAVVGDIFFAVLGPAPMHGDYVAALTAALGCNLVLQLATFLLVLRIPALTPKSAVP